MGYQAKMMGKVYSIKGSVHQSFSDVPFVLKKVPLLSGKVSTKIGLRGKGDVNKVGEVVHASVLHFLEKGNLDKFCNDLLFSGWLDKNRFSQNLGKILEEIKRMETFQDNSIK